MIIFPCPHCGRGTRAQGAGPVTCRHCGQVATAPLSDQPSPATPTPPPQEFLDCRAIDPTVALGETSANLTINAESELCEFLVPPKTEEERGWLGPYRVLRVLGVGGMGIVFQAEDTHLKRYVAIKALRPALAACETARRRFLNEARAAAAIKHDHVVYINHVGEHKGIPFLVMEFLEGESLEMRIRREKRLPFDDVLRIGREAASGLAAAHDRGLIHRDVKPSNLWLEGEQGKVKVLDFGLARGAPGEDGDLTQIGFVVGTPSYMSPEQARGETVDSRTDLFSLGCVLYRLVTGELPFRGPDALSTLIALGADHPEPPQQLSSDIPPALGDVILRLLSKDPANRPSCAAVVVEVMRWIELDQAGVLPPLEQTRIRQAATRSFWRSLRLFRSDSKK